MSGDINDIGKSGREHNDAFYWNFKYLCYSYSM